MIRVSVIIPTYNRAAYLREAIDSVLGQTFVDFELIVVDDGSTDNTKEVVASIEDSRIFYKYQENSGVAAARNTGITISKGEYIAFLDSDDVWLPHNLEIKVRSLDTHPAAGLVCSDAYISDYKTKSVLGHLWHGKPFNHQVDPAVAEAQPLQEMLRRGCFIMPQAAVVRHNVFAKCGYFDESLRSGEDWDMFVRIVRHFPVATIDIPLLRIQRHDDSLSGSWDKWYQADVAIAVKAIKKFNLAKADLHVVKYRLARHHFLYGRNQIVNGQIATGRKALLASMKVKVWVWSIKSAGYFLLSIIGSRWILTLKALKKAFGRRLAWHQSPEEA